MYLFKSFCFVPFQPSPDGNTDRIYFIHHIQLLMFYIIVNKEEKKGLKVVFYVSKIKYYLHNFF